MKKDQAKEDQEFAEWFKRAPRRTTQLSKRDWVRLREIMESNEGPNEALKKLANDYKRRGED